MNPWAVTTQSFLADHHPLPHQQKCFWWPR